MGCIAALFALISPRLALFVTWVFTGVLGQAFESWLVPVIGFFLLPWTTLAFAWMWVLGPDGVVGFEWFIVIIAFLGDLGAYGAGRRASAGRRAA